MEKIRKFTFVPINDVFTQDVKNNSDPNRYSNPEIEVHPSKCVLPNKFKESFEKIYNFQVFPDDVWIITYPKSGNLT